MPHPRLILCTIALCALALLAPLRALAHPVIQNGLDITIRKFAVHIEARVMMEQVLLVENGGKPGAANAPDAPLDRWPALVTSHEKYVLTHLKIAADGKELIGKITQSTAPGSPAKPATTTPIQPVPADTSTGTMALFIIEYPLPSPPAEVRIDQDFLREFGWQSACVVRVRQEDGQWEMAMLTPHRSIEYGCDWTANPASRPSLKSDGGSAPAAIGQSFWPTARAYLFLGIDHILGWDDQAHRPGGLDHILFVCALVLAVRSLWDLIKVVTAFTLAHTLTLTLSTLSLTWPALNWINVPRGFVELMIAASIIAIALQNVLWPTSARGKARLAIAFAFGLFHGLGFAGGLKQAMSEMPGSTMATALGSFSLGVELGHQIIVLPLFILLYAARYAGRTADHPRPWVATAAMRYCSALICAGGIWFLVEALK